MEYDWIIEQPIDFEYKQYLVLDYIKKVENKLDSFELYPSFQELTIHYSSMQRILSDGQFITLKRLPEDFDDEILLTDLVYNSIRTKGDEESNEILKIAEYASDKFRNMFMVSKTLWSLVNDSISIKKVINEESIKELKRGSGFFYFVYKKEFYVYQFKIKRITKKTMENKCYIEKIYQGSKHNIGEIINENHLYKKNDGNVYRGNDLDKEEVEERINTVPWFELSISQEFPLDGCLISLLKRRIMSYIFQTVKLQELKND